MMLDDILAFSADQERGRWFDLADPVTGKLTGIRLRIAGPDSATQNRAQLHLADTLAERAGEDGRVSAEVREAARIDTLARCVLAWEIMEDGQDVPFTHANVVRFLKAAKWVQAQVDAWAGDRAAFRGEG
jgi:hypothetical protein